MMILFIFLFLFHHSVFDQDNRLRRFTLRLTSLSEDGQASELVGTPSALGQRLQSFRILERKRRNSLLEVATPLEATTTVDEETAAKQEAQRADRLGLNIFTDGSWRHWLRGHLDERKYLERSQDSHGLGPGSLRRRMCGNCKGHTGSGRDHTLGTVTIFRDHLEGDLRRPGAGQKHATIARKHIATLRAKGPNVKVEIRWCPSHQGIEGNEVADEWANSPPMSRTPMEWSGSASRTHAAWSGRDASPSQDPWPTSNAVSRKRIGRMRKIG